jgi:hypothetical protein
MLLLVLNTIDREWIDQCVSITFSITQCERIRITSVLLRDGYSLRNINLLLRASADQAAKV